MRRRVMLAVLVALCGMSMLAVAPSAVGASSTQFTMFDQSVSHRATKYAQPTTAGPTNWESPVDYRRGRAFLRFEVTAKPTTFPLTAQLCLWRNSYAQETCSRSHPFSTTGLYWFDLGSPDSWWKMNGTWDFTTPFSPARLMIKDPSRGELLMTGACGAYCYTGPETVTDHVPILINATLVMVAAGETLQPPPSWTDCPRGWSPMCGATANTAPVARAGIDARVALEPDTPHRLGGSVTDDGLPTPPGATTASWSVESGPGGATFHEPNSPTSAVEFDTFGTYVLELTASDGQLVDTDTVVITVLPPTSGGLAKLVASRSVPDASDRFYVQWLEELGFTVAVVDDDGLTAASLEGADLVVISSTVSPAKIGSWIAGIDAPILSSEVNLAAKLGFGVRGQELTGQTRIRIFDSTSPLAAGFTGSVPIAKSATTVGGVQRWGPEVRVVAKTASTSSTVATIVEVDEGAALSTGIAPERRVGFFLGAATPRVANANGRALFDMAVAWLAPPEPLPWWNTDWEYRRLIKVAADDTDRTDAIATIPVDLTPRPNAGSPLDVGSLRVVEIDEAGGVIDAAVVFQFDPGPGFDPASSAKGELVVLASGVTSADAQRRFHVYYDSVSAGHPPVSFTDLVAVTPGNDEGQAGFDIALSGQRWFFQGQGAGFSSMEDVDGNDWLSYSTATGSAGQFRGMPNAVHPQGHFHPGATTSTSTLVSDGPLRAVIDSTTTDGLWKTRWEMFPTFARMTMVTFGDDYWFLYEGTPGGAVDPSDTVMRSTGEVTAHNFAWVGDLVGEEWVAFGDGGLGRSVYVSHQTPDEAIDSYRLMNGEMTVFGFGRNLAAADYLVGSHTFAVGFVDAVDQPTVRAAVTSATTRVGSARPIEVVPAP